MRPQSARDTVMTELSATESTPNRVRDAADDIVSATGLATHLGMTLQNVARRRSSSSASTAATTTSTASRRSTPKHDLCD